MTKTALPLKKAIAIFVLSLSCFSGHAQVAAEVQQRFEQYQSNTLQEKVFVHTDKDTYLPGELLWFKAYSTDARNRKPLSLNRVMYVEVIDAGRHAVLQASVNLKDGLANGSLQIPSSVSTGNYQLRAYTSWMKNFSPDLYFEKNITVINPFKASANSAKPSGPAFDVQFFPEGGEMVKGISSRIGFKAVGRDGAGLSVSGAVLNQQNDTVARFRSLKFGMGSFDFTPGQAGAYTVVVAGGNSQVRKQL